MRDFERQHDVGSKIELVSVDTREGAATASLYDILSYPSIVALANDGSVLSSWSDLPLMDELASYMYS